VVRCCGAGLLQNASADTVSYRVDGGRLYEHSAFGGMTWENDHDS